MISVLAFEFEIAVNLHKAEKNMAQPIQFAGKCI